jgi:serine/threonine-protein kinase
MNPRLPLLALLALAGSLGLTGSQARAQLPPDAPPTNLGAAVKKIFETNCAVCHGGDKPARGIKILDRKVLVETKKVVVPGKPDDSKLFKIIGRDAMPPDEDNDGKPLKRLTKQEKDTIKSWIAAGAPDFDAPVVGIAIPGKKPAEGNGPGKAADLPPDPPPPVPDLGAAVKKIFETNCAVCHGGDKPVRGLRILDRKVLVNKTKKVVVPGKPDESKLFDLVKRDEMPPDEDNNRKPLKRLTKEEKETIRDWIAAGAPDFAAALLEEKGTGEKGTGTDYVLGEILRDVRSLDAETRARVRYFSLAHLVTAGASEDEMAQHRDALAKTINHLHRQPELIQPKAVDKLQTIYRIDLKELGWDRPVLKPAAPGRASLNAFDLVLLEYPYGMIYSTDDYTALVTDYLTPAQMARPVPFVRGDWFVSRATLPPLYFELLNLPTTLKELEKELGVDTRDNLARNRAARAGMVESKLSRNSRAVERHPLPGGGYYWRAYEYASGAGVLADPVNLRPDGGDMIFSLPNGLQAYFMVNKDGKRIDSAPLEIMADTTATGTVEGQTVRTGLSCIRCHETGMRPFADDVRPTVLKLANTPFDRQRALDLYPEKETMDRFLQEDSDRFVKALTQLLGKKPEGEPLTPVSRRFEDRLTLTQASAELGRTKLDGLEETFQDAQFIRAGLSAWLRTDKPGKVARDGWEAHFGDVARELKLGVPLLPMDSSIRLQEEPLKRPFRFAAVLNDESDQKVFNRGEELKVFVITDKKVFVEIIRTDTAGNQTVLTAPDTSINPRETVQVPLRGGGLKVSDKPGTEQITLLLSETAFRPGEVLTTASGRSRVVHRTATPEKGNAAQPPDLDAARTVKKTFLIEVK